MEPKFKTMLGASSLLLLVSNWHLKKSCVLYSAKPELYNIDVTEKHPKTIETALKHCETYQLYADKTKCAAHTTVAFQDAVSFVDNFYQNQLVNDRKYVILDSGCGAGMSTVCLAKLHPNIPIIGIDRSIARLSRNKKLTIKDSSAILTQEQGDVVLVDDENEKKVQMSSDRSSSDPEKILMSSRSRISIENDAMYIGEIQDHVDTFEQDDASDESDEDTAIEEEASVQLMSNAILLRAELSDFFTLVAYESDWVVHSHYLLYPNPYPKGKHLKRRWHGHPILPVILSIGRPLSHIV